MSQQNVPDRDAASTHPRGRHNALDIEKLGIGQRAEDTRRRALVELGRQFGDDQSPAPRSCQQGGEGGGHPVFYLSGISGRFGRTFEDRGCQDPKLGGACRSCETRDEEIEGPRTERTSPWLAEWLQQESTPTTKKWCGHCHRQSRHQPDPKVVRWRPSLSQHSQWTESCELIRSRSGCCCCAASACQCPSPAVSAPPT